MYAPRIDDLPVVFVWLAVQRERGVSVTTGGLVEGLAEGSPAFLVLRHLTPQFWLVFVPVIVDAVTVFGFVAVASGSAHAV